MKTFYYLAICAALMMTSCDNESSNGNGDIVLTGNTPKEIVVKADDNGSNQAIKFTAVAPWTATVKDVTPSRSEQESEVEWIKLSAYSGEAGDVSLDLSFSKNLTGVTRKAEILIQCGKTTIKITIEQVAENADGTVTKQVKTLGIRYEYNSETVGNTGANPIAEQTATYSYDKQGRVAKITSIDEDGSNYSYETIYDYTIVNEIQIASREYHNGETYEEKYIADLNDKGNAVRVRKFYEGKYIDKNTIEYSEDERIIRIREYDEYGELEEEINYTYDNDGYLIKAVAEDRYDYDTEIYNFDIPTFYPNKYPNNNIIEMMSFYTDCPFAFDNESNIMLSTIGRLGKTGDYFIERVKKEKLDTNYPFETSTEKPGTVIREEKYQRADFNNYDDEYSCEYDNDNNLKKVIITSKFDIEEISYKIVVSDEIAETTEDGINIYYCKTTDYKKVKTDEGEDITTYTINY